MNFHLNIVNENTEKVSENREVPLPYLDQIELSCSHTHFTRNFMISYTS